MKTPEKVLEMKSKGAKIWKKSAKQEDANKYPDSGKYPGLRFHRFKGKSQGLDFSRT
jgi:hypothetical protein